MKQTTRKSPKAVNVKTNRPSKASNIASKKKSSKGETKANQDIRFRTNVKSFLEYVRHDATADAYEEISHLMLSVTHGSVSIEDALHLLILATIRKRNMANAYRNLSKDND